MGTHICRNNNFISIHTVVGLYLSQNQSPKIHSTKTTEKKTINLLQSLQCLHSLNMTMDLSTDQLGNLLNAVASDDLQKLSVNFKLESPENFWISILPNKLDNLRELDVRAESMEEETEDARSLLDAISPVPMHCSMLTIIHVTLRPRRLWKQVGD